MTTASLVQQMIDRLGTSQGERDDPRLDPAHAPIDGRSTDELLRHVRALAQQLRYYRDTPITEDGTWAPWFETSDDALLEHARRSDGGVPPHLALVIAFLRQQRDAQALLDGFTARHLRFQMQQVLGFTPRAARPDRAHLVLELKKGSAPVEITPQHAFTAGADARRIEQLYRPVRNTVIGHAAVQQLASLSRDGDVLVAAPIANSADGLGAALDAAQPRWPPFARQATRAAAVGFALASPLLRLAGGERRIEIALTLDGLQPRHDAAALGASFEGWLTGPKGWLGPFTLQATRSGDSVTLVLEVAASEPAVIDHAHAVHLQGFPDALPVLQLLLRASAPLAFGALAGLALKTASVAVAVRGLKQLALENDLGTLDAKKAFLPFGPQPVAGARLLIGCAEALSKPLTELKIRLQWQGAPADLHAWYRGYARQSQMSNGVSAALTFEDAAGQTRTNTLDLMARDSDGATVLSPSSPSPAPAKWASRTRMRAMLHGGNARTRRLAGIEALLLPLLRADLVATAPPAARAGFVTVTLIDDFLHADHRRDAVKALLKSPPDPINDPYTPMVRDIALDYSARSAPSELERAEADAFTDTDVWCFHVDAFGAARVHAWLGAAQPGGAGTVPLLAPHADAGELLIGLSGVGAGDSVSLLFQAAEGSADPEATPQTLRWSVLADNGWRTLAPEEVTLDTTRHLRTSGLVALVLPRETSTGHTLLAPGLAWLRASILAEPRAACDLVGVHANAVELVFDDTRANAPHGDAALAAGSIVKLKTPVAEVKSVAQAYASFGGAAEESETALARRAAERLRHRDRCIAPWDWERIVLEAFPSVHRAKCIPHANPRSWLAPGHVMLVLVPDLRNHNAIDPLRPRVDLDTQQRVHAHVKARCAPAVQVWVRNPSYREVRLSFKLKLRPGFGFNFYRGVVHDAIVRALSPWAFDRTRALGFGGRVERSVLLDLVEELDSVDYVTDFRMFVDDGPDVAEAQADTPDAILVSASLHDIVEVVEG
jgi:hypothetical protein